MLIAFEVLLVTVVILFVITQIGIPAILGRKLFPLFSKQAKLEAAMAKARQAEAEKELEQRVKEAQDRVRDRKSTKGK